MGEGRRDRSGKRQRSYYGAKSSSDSELAQGKSKGRKGKVKERWPFPDGLTVDELARYRRRRVQGQPRDNVERLKSDGLSRNLISEYQRAFRASSEDLLKENIRPDKSKQPPDFLRLEGSVEIAQPSYREDFKEFEHVNLPLRNKGPSSSLVLADADATMETETENSRFIAHAHPVTQPLLVRRGTSIKSEGNFYTDTEMYSAYVAHEGIHKPELARRPTSLKMEGDMDTMTEKCEKFIEWLNVSRPELMRMQTHLKLEGELETTTENQEKYVPFVGVRRPELLRQNTNLKLEGDSVFSPEYADVFRKHKIEGRPVLVKPETHLKTGRDFYRRTENADHFVDIRKKEEELMAQLTKDIENEEVEKKKEKEKKKQERENERKEREMQMLVSKLEDLKGPPLEIPEYKDAYKDFPREKPKLAKPEDEIGRADGSKIPSSPTHSKFSTKIDQDPEYKSKYLDYPKECPLYRKPPLPLRSTMGSSTRIYPGFDKSDRSNARRYNYQPTSEVRSQYIPYGHVPRVKSLKMPPNLRLEGNFDLQPEYRNAYCSNNEYQSHSRQKDRDRSPSASRSKENYWMNNNNSERFGCVNAAQDQDAFQVLNTRIHEENVVGKPPPGNRRNSRTGQIQAQRPTELDITERGNVRNRSPSPTFRLHVCNVDDEPRGFGQRKQSSTFESAGKLLIPSSDHTVEYETERPYSPSFGKTSRQQADKQSFVVLDDTTVNQCDKKEGRRRRVEKNRNMNSSSTISSSRPRTPTNWMPPWYDSTNTI